MYFAFFNPNHSKKTLQYLIGVT